ncbi:DUF1801 domain-containing protein [Salinimicrobium sediminilitoris]|uniref:DUF1801 domain-containing protein n=1 Tax=Salinimicrobium sediminilitoris TaxID=2876715 RepID=UPI001E612652|nr:DUF1801 domain-containing protein [Salinimicrobium sediminilitoris]MCC8358663.1 DUF1801 domain-containing protein [Salinimicrobium sediminilitoris]
MADLKIKQNDASVTDFLDQIENKQRQSDCRELLKMFSEVTGEPAKMWGENMIGFGKYHYKYKSGHEGDWFLTGFSPRKQNLTIYIMTGFKEYNDILENLGKYKTSSSCLYVKKLEDINREKLSKLIRRSVEDLRKRYN